jgi:hypothetical protein
MSKKTKKLQLSKESLRLVTGGDGFVPAPSVNVSCLHPEQCQGRGSNLAAGCGVTH